MGTGLGMASVNKIKELAAAREYSVAVELLDNQDLTKSLNPQFLRVCGEVYTENNRILDARKLLVKAHQMAPEGNRIISSLIYLYLKAGYWDLADIYFAQLEFNCNDNDLELQKSKYYINKAKRKDYSLLLDQITRICDHNLDEVWSLELFLLYILTDNIDNAKILSNDYKAAFKDSRNCELINDIMTSKKSAKECFNIFTESKCNDDSNEQELIRIEEKEQLLKDNLRMYPKEPEITIMIDDNEEDNASLKIKKKFIKLYAKRSKINSDEDIIDEEKIDEETQNGSPDENDMNTNANSDEISDINSDEIEEENECDDDKKVRLNAFNKIGKLFSKNKVNKEIDDTKTDIELETVQVNEIVEPTNTEVEMVVDESGTSTSTELDSTHVMSDSDDISDAYDDISDSADDISDSADDISDSADDTSDSSEIVLDNNFTEEISEELSVTIEENEKEEGLMQEIHLKEDSDIEKMISFDFDDGFVAESEDIDGLCDSSDSDFETDYSNPFPNINNEPTKNNDDHDSDVDIANNHQNSIVEQFDNNEELIKVDIDDFDAEFEAEFESEFEAEFNSDFESDIDEAFESEFENEFIAEVDETDVEVSDIEESEVEETDIVVTDIEELEVEETDVEVSDIEELEVEEEDVEVTDIEELEVEEEDVEVTDIEELEVEETDVESTDIEELEVEETDVDEVQTDNQDNEYIEQADNTSESCYQNSDNLETNEIELETDNLNDIDNSNELVEENHDIGVKTEEKTTKLDFPEFKTDLFPSIKNKSIQNNFDNILNNKQKEMQHQLEEEARIQRETEELLKSLGIDLNNVASNSNVEFGDLFIDDTQRKDLIKSLKINANKKKLLRDLKKNK